MPETLELNVADYVILGLLAVGILQGFIRGLSGELARVVGWVAALWIGWKYSTPIGEWLGQHSRLEGVSAFLGGFLVAVIATGVVMYALFLVLRLIMQFSFKGKLERLGGMLAGFVRMGAFVAVAILAISLWRQEALHAIVCEESIIGRTVSGRLMPLYGQLLESHPEWHLPRPPGDAPDAEPEQPAESGEDDTPLPDLSGWEHWPAQ